MGETVVGAVEGTQGRDERADGTNDEVNVGVINEGDAVDKSGEGEEVGRNDTEGDDVGETVGEGVG